jgi:hypothetical protein
MENQAAGQHFCFSVLKVIEYRKTFAGGIECCHSFLALPVNRYRDLGGSSIADVSRMLPTSLWKCIWHALAREMPAMRPNGGASRCQPIPAPG